MPLEQRVIQPIYVSRGCFNHQGQVATNIPNELECVTNGTLANIIRQLSSLSKHAENLFGCLLDDMSSMLQRSVRLQVRIDSLIQHVEQLDVAANDASGMTHLHQRRAPAAPRAEQFDQQVVARATIPDSLREVYESCDPPPALDKLNPFRDDNINGLKLYTNPNYFFELWRKEMLQENKTKNKVAKNRQGDNMHNAAASGAKSKRNRQRSLPHQSSSETSYSQQLPVHEQYQQQQQQQYYPPPQQQAAVAAAGIHSQMEILTAKATMANPNPQHGPPYTVIEGSYIDPNNYQHHYVQHQYTQNNNSKPQFGQRPNSLELQQQQNYQYYGGYASGNNQRVPATASNQYQPAAQQSPGGTALTPTRRMQAAAGVSRPSAPPPAPPAGSAGNSAPNSMPGTPMHKKMNGQEVELREAPNRSTASRDSLPPPPPPPPPPANAGPMNGVLNASGGNEADVPDSMLPPPPPPPPPPPAGGPSFNGNQSTNLTSPPPPPPPPSSATGNGQIPGASPGCGQQQQPAFKPSVGSMLTAEELQSVKLKKIDPAAVQHSQSDPQDDVRSNLLAAIRHGIKLKRVEESRQREVEQNAPLRDVASILARRVALELSDSDGDGAEDGADDDDDSDAWDDESEC